MKRKAFAYILRHTQQTPQLLVLSFDQRAQPPFRLPGGTLEPDEEPLVGMTRELLEETGIANFSVIRKLGVKHYYKLFIQMDVERHDFLLRLHDDIGDHFSYVVQGNGDDAGERFFYHWLDANHVALLDPEFGHDVTPDYVPELFTQSKR